MPVARSAPCQRSPVRSRSAPSWRRRSACMWDSLCRSRPEARAEPPRALRPNVTVEEGSSLGGFRAKPNAPSHYSRDLGSPRDGESPPAKHRQGVRLPASPRFSWRGGETSAASRSPGPSAVHSFRPPAAQGPDPPAASAFAYAGRDFASRLKISSTSSPSAMVVGSCLVAATLEQATEEAGGATHTGVDCRDWPCGQNPGRQPEGRQRASAREAMSLGEQSSTCRASTFVRRAELKMGRTVAPP